MLWVVYAVEARALLAARARDRNEEKTIAFPKGHANEELRHQLY